MGGFRSRTGANREQKRSDPNRGGVHTLPLTTNHGLDEYSQETANTREYTRMLQSPTECSRSSAPAASGVEALWAFVQRALQGVGRGDRSALPARDGDAGGVDWATVEDGQSPYGRQLLEIDMNSPIARTVPLCRRPLVPAVN